MEYDSALGRNKIPTPATTWMSSENIVLSEISRAQKDGFRSHELPSLVELAEPPSRRVVDRVWGKRGMRTQCLMGTEPP